MNRMLAASGSALASQSIPHNEIACWRHLSPHLLLWAHDAVPTNMQLTGRVRRSTRTSPRACTVW